MILVVIGHAIQNELGEACENSHLWNVIYSFHMPAFMAVSGWLFYQPPHPQKSFIPIKKRSYLEICIRRGYQLIIPYFIWSLLVFLLRGQYSIDRFANIVFQPDCYFWFLWVLFGIAVIFSGVKIFSRHLIINETILILSVCLVLLTLMVTLELRVFGFQFLAYYFIFYTIGYCLHKYENKLSKLKHPVVLFILFVAWLLLAWEWRMHDLPSFIQRIYNVPSTILQYVYRGVTAFFAVIILLMTCPSIINGKNKLNQKICIIGDASLGIYVVHMTIMGYMKECIHLLSITDPYINVMMIFIATFISSVLLVILLKKNKHTAKLFLGKI